MAAPAADRYKLGVMATMYSSVPLDDAMTRIRKIGYKYVSLSRRHANEPVFDPAMSKPDRKAMLRHVVPPSSTSTISGRVPSRIGQPE